VALSAGGLSLSLRSPTQKEWCAGWLPVFVLGIESPRELTDTERRERVFIFKKILQQPKWSIASTHFCVGFDVKLLSFIILHFETLKVCSSKRVPRRYQTGETSGIPQRYRRLAYGVRGDILHSIILLRGTGYYR
jgi:hypothetical protein